MLHNNINAHNIYRVLIYSNVSSCIRLCIYNYVYAFSFYMDYINAWIQDL